MRRDLCYFYPANVESVYSAYKTAIKQKFDKDADETPYKMLVFGLNFSFRYNMNGGGVHVYFMPYNNGTAVNLRYTIAQATGARYGAHAKDMTSCVESILRVPAQSIEIDVEQFVKYKDSAPVQQATPAPTVQPVYNNVNPNNNFNEAPKSRFCVRCGTQFGENDRFCMNCGEKRI